MKTIKSIICLLILAIFVTTTNGQIYTNKDISTLLIKSEKDSLAQIERLAALKFHKLINSYRKDNGLKTLEWDETLWVATINHNAWMAEAKKLSHHQTKKNIYFTGVNPGDRFDYAAGGNSPNNWSAENALYNYSVYGKNINEIAENIASSSFTQWKNSPGHNSNMLGNSHVTHGVAFKISGDKIWGTDLFASNNAPYTINNDVPLYTKVEKKKGKRFSTFKTKRKLTDEINRVFSVKRKNSNKEEAKIQASRLLIKKFKQNEGVIYSKKTTSETNRFLGLIKKKKYTYELVLEEPIYNFDLLSTTKKILTLINENQSINTKSKLDLGVALKKRNDVVRITLVSIIYQPKSKKYAF